MFNPFVLHQGMHAIDARDDERNFASQDPELATLLAFTKGEMELYQSHKNCRLL